MILVSLFLIHGQSRSIPCLERRRRAWITPQCSGRHGFRCAHQSSRRGRGATKQDARRFPAFALPQSRNVREWRQMEHRLRKGIPPGLCHPHIGPRCLLDSTRDMDCLPQVIWRRIIAITGQPRPRVSPRKPCHSISKRDRSLNSVGAG
jgi:hypothetical protein